jgi:hypothetical protein
LFLLILVQVRTSLLLLLLLLLLFLLLLTAIELSLGGSSPYTSTNKRNKKKYTQTKLYKTQSTNNIKYSKYQYTLPKHAHNCQNTHTLPKPPQDSKTNEVICSLIYVFTACLRGMSIVLEIQRGMVELLVNSKGSGRKRSWSNLRH